jgi:hypothetical protein
MSAAGGTCRRIGVQRSARKLSVASVSKERVGSVSAFGTWHLAPGTWHLAPGTWQLGAGTWLLAPGSWLLAPGSYLITNRSVIRVSTCFRFSSKAVSDSLVSISIKGSDVIVTLEKGFGTAKPSHDLNRQKAEYSTSNGNKGT